MRTRMVVVSILCSVLMCWGQCKEGRDTMILIDDTGSFRKQFESAKIVIKRLILKLCPGDRLVVRRITKESFSDQDDELIVSIPESRREMDLMSIRKATLRMKYARSKIDSMVFGNATHTDIRGALYSAMYSFENSSRKQKHLLVFTDLLETVHRKGVIPKLHGVNVVVLMVTTGYDISIVRKLLGHSSIVTTMIYAKVDVRTMRNAIRSLEILQESGCKLVAGRKDATELPDL